MARYHLSPKDGQPRVCSARIKCDYADANDGKGVEQYPNKAEADKAYEANLAETNETFKKISKEENEPQHTETEKKQILHALYTDNKLKEWEYDALGYSKENVEKMKHTSMLSKSPNAADEFEMLTNISNKRESLEQKKSIMERNEMLNFEADHRVIKANVTLEKGSLYRREEIELLGRIKKLEIAQAEQYFEYKDSVSEYDKAALEHHKAVKDYDQKYMGRNFE